MKTKTILLLLASNLISLGAYAANPSCKKVGGTWDSKAVVDPAKCQSPAHFCTAGQLYVAIKGTYTFSMNTGTPSPEATTPTVNYYTGVSVIQTAKGSLTGTDNGVNDPTPAGATPSSGQFVSMIPIHTGTGNLTGATGYLLLRGKLVIPTQPGEIPTASGDYEGQICVPSQAKSVPSDVDAIEVEACKPAQTRTSVDAQGKKHSFECVYNEKLGAGYRDPSGLIWWTQLNFDRSLHGAATAACGNAGLRLPSQEEFVNLALYAGAEIDSDGDYHDGRYDSPIPGFAFNSRQEHFFWSSTATKYSRTEHYAFGGSEGVIKGFTDSVYKNEVRCVSH